MMDKQELESALDELRVARNYLDRAIDKLTELLHTPTEHDLQLRLAALEGWEEMEKYMGGRKQ
jgi:hypothetical protein